MCVHTAHAHLCRRNFHWRQKSAPCRDASMGQYTTCKLTCNSPVSAVSVSYFPTVANTARFSWNYKLLCNHKYNQYIFLLPFERLTGIYNSVNLNLSDWCQCVAVAARPGHRPILASSKNFLPLDTVRCIQYALIIDSGLYNYQSSPIAKEL